LSVGQAAALPGLTEACPAPLALAAAAMTRLSMSTALQVWRTKTCGQDESACSKSATMLLTFILRRRLATISASFSPGLRHSTSLRAGWRHETAEGHPVFPTAGARRSAFSWTGPGHAAVVNAPPEDARGSSGTVKSPENSQFYGTIPERSLLDVAEAWQRAFQRRSPEKLDRTLCSSPSLSHGWPWSAGSHCGRGGSAKCFSH